MGAPGCPDLACSTASTARNRMVLMHNSSRLAPDIHYPRMTRGRKATDCSKPLKKQVSAVAALVSTPPSAPDYIT